MRHCHGIVISSKQNINQLKWFHSKWRQLDSGKKFRIEFNSWDIGKYFCWDEIVANEEEKNMIARDIEEG